MLLSRQQQIQQRLLNVEQRSESESEDFCSDAECEEEEEKKQGRLVELPRSMLVKQENKQAVTLQLASLALRSCRAALPTSHAAL